MSDVAVCNLAFAGRLEELRALLLRDRAQATRADQVSRGRPGAAPASLSPSLPRSPLPSRRITAPRCTGPARRDTRTSLSSCSGWTCL